MLVAVMVCVPLLPTGTVTETALGETDKLAAEGGGVLGLVLPEVTAPAQPEIPKTTTRIARRNTKSVPRFERERFNVKSSLFFVFCSLVRTAERAVWLGP